MHDEVTRPGPPTPPGPAGGGAHQEPGPGASPTPSRIGRYTILRVLGEGGMGIVYEAQQDNPQRTVALKVIRAGYLSTELLRRFGQESQVLGRLQHPGIAQVYEAGTTSDSPPVPYFAMEFIKGLPLTDYAAIHNLGTRARLDLIAKICDAVYHAHQKGVIHRDLKPGNIIVDGSGQPKILDFGVARATDSDVQTTTLQTDIGQLIGTIPYMSPEQVGGDPADLDTRSDVYALGVIAYELLAGRLPYDLQRKVIHEAARIIREEEPTRLSSVNRTLRGDVETIISRALEKDKTRRYQSAESLASDIRRYLTDQPIAARPASTWYQLVKFSKRNRGLVGGVAASFILLIAGVIATGVSLNRALHAEKSLSGELVKTEEARKGEQAERQKAQRATAAAEYEAYTAQLVAAERSIATGDLVQARVALNHSPLALRNWEWGYLNAQVDKSVFSIPRAGTCLAVMPGTGWALVTRDTNCALIEPTTGATLRFLGGTTTAASTASFTPDGARVITGERRGVATVWDCRTGIPLATFTQTPLTIMSVRISSDGSRALTVNFGDVVRVWDVNEGCLVAEFRGGSVVGHTADLNCDGTRVLFAGLESPPTLWNVQNGEKRTGPPVSRGAWFSPDGKFIVNMSGGPTASIHDGTSFNMLRDLTGHTNTISELAFTPLSPLVATASLDKTICLWDLATGELVAKSPPLPDSPAGIRFGDDGTSITCRVGSSAFIWNCNSGRLTRVGTHLKPCTFVSPIARGELVVSSDADRTLCVWDAHPPAPPKVPPPRRGVSNSATFSPDGQVLAVTGSDDQARLFDTTSQRLLSVTEVHPSFPVAFLTAAGELITLATDKVGRRWEVPSARFLGPLQADRHNLISATLSPDGRRALAWYDDDHSVLYDAQAGSIVSTLRGGGPGLFDASGRVFTSAADGTVRVWNSHNGAAEAFVRTGAGPLSFLQVTRDGRRVLAVAADGSACVADLSASTNCLFSSEPASVRMARLSPDGQRLLVLPNSGPAKLLRLPEGNLIAEFSSSVTAAEFTDSGETVALVRADGVVDVVSASSGAAFKQLTNLARDKVLCCDFNAKGTHLAIGDALGVIGVVDLDSGKIIAANRPYAKNIRALQFSAGDSMIASTSDEAACRLWDVSRNELLNLLGPDGQRLYTAPVTAARFNADGSRVLSACADGILRIFDTSKRRQTGNTSSTQFNRLASFERAPGVTGGVMSADRTRLLVTSESGYLLWDTRTCQPVPDAKPPPPSNQIVGGVVLSSNGAFGAYANWNGLVVTWDTATGSPLHTVDVDDKNLRSLAVSPDDRLLAAGALAGDCIIIDVKTGTVTTRLRGHDRDVYAVAFHPSGTRLATIGADRSLRIWDTTTWRQLCVLRGPESSGRSLAFSPDGSSLVTCAEDGTIHILSSLTFRERYPERQAWRSAERSISDHIKQRLRSGEDPEITLRAGQDSSVYTQVQRRAWVAELTAAGRSSVVPAEKAASP